MDRQKIPGSNVMFEPWMMPEKEDGHGVEDFRLREKVCCGLSIVNRNMFQVLHTIMMAELPDFCGSMKSGYREGNLDVPTRYSFVYLYNKTTCSAGGSPSGFSPR